MNNTKFASLIFLITTLSWPIHAEETRYISDTLITYLHGGPNQNFRIIGSVTAGEAVQIIEVNQTTKYARILDTKGKNGWLPVDQLNTEPSARTRVPELEKQVKILSGQLESINDSWNKKNIDMQEKITNNNATINQLKQENNRLSAELNTANKKMEEMSISINNEQRTVIQQWFLYGGAVAGGGLLLGVLLPSFLPRRKKDRWMN